MVEYLFNLLQSKIQNIVGRIFFSYEKNTARVILAIQK